MMKPFIGIIVTVLLCIISVATITFGFNYEMTSLEAILVGLVCGVISVVISE